MNISAEAAGAAHAGLDEFDTVVAKQACHDLVIRFASCNDKRDAQGLAALFAEDGVLVRPNGDTLTGPAAIAAAYADRPADRITRHLVGNVLIEVTSPTTATGASTVLLWSGSAADAAGPYGRPMKSREVMGEFEDSFVKTSGGWRIARRTARFIFVRESAA
jgi:uncharacterized protein (TIGR02246 family)